MEHSETVQLWINGPSCRQYATENMPLKSVLVLLPIISLCFVAAIHLAILLHHAFHAMVCDLSLVSNNGALTTGIKIPKS